MNRLIGSLLVLLFSAACVARADTQPWRALTDMELDVAAGSVLDFSALNEPGPAGQYGWARVLDGGHIGFERKSAPQRFLCASLAFSPISGGMPDKASADRLVVQLKRTGYNAVRLHYVDAMLMSGRVRDFDFDPEQFDRFHYLLARLKEAGLYWVVDVVTSDNGAYGNVMPNRWVKKHQLKSGIYFDEQQQAHWRRLASEILGRRNPYTGVSIAADPATLGVILVNEGSLAYLSTISGKGYPPELAARFSDWLAARYPDERSFASKWAGARQGEEAPKRRNVAVPREVRAKDARGEDFMRFVSEMEQDTVRWMSDHVRSLGYRGLITSLDNWSFHQTDVSRSALSWVDMHAYHALPTAFASPGSRIDQSSVVAGAAKYVRELTNSRQWGKPFSVTEYGQPFWDQWRRESAAVVPAYAGLQGWDLICLFAENPIQFDYRPSPYARRNAIYPFGIGADPILRVGERLSALLFRRGDVATANGHVSVQMSADQVFASSAGWSQMPEAISRTALVTGYGIQFPGSPVLSGGSKAVNFTLGGGDAGIAARIANVANRAGLGAGDRFATLKGAGILGPENRTDPARGIFQSDTGEILLNAERAEFAVATARTAVTTFRSAPATAGPLAVPEASGPALVAVSSTDGLPIKESRRLLLFALTDAVNSGMSFEDDERTKLTSLGGFPPKVLTLRASIRIDGVRGGAFRAYPLSLSGQRRTEIPVRRTSTGLEMALDTGALADGPALMFEIVQD